MELFGSILGTTAVQAMRIWAAMGYSVAKLQFILYQTAWLQHMGF